MKVWFKADSFYPLTDYYSADNQTQVWPAGTRNYYSSVSAKPIEGIFDSINFSVSSSGSSTITVLLIIVVVISTFAFYLYFRKNNSIHGSIS